MGEISLQLVTTYPGVNPLVYTKTVCFSRALIGYSINEYPVLFTDLLPVPPSERRQTRASCEQNAFPVCCRDKKEISQLIKQAVPEIHEEGDEVRFGSFNMLCLFDLNLSIKPVKKILVYKSN